MLPAGLQLRPALWRRAACVGATPALATVALLSAAVLLAMGGCKQTTKSVAAANPSLPHASHSATPTEGQTDPTTDVNYDAISERNLFRPLVTAPKPAGAGAGGAQAGAGAPPSTKAGGQSPGGSRGPASAGPPDPTADLALTGIIETTDGLRALVEQISTRRGEFVAAGEQAFGLTVKAITAGAITLAQGPRTYELKLGAKEMPAVQPAAVASAASATPSPSASSTSSGSPSGMPSFGGMSSDQRRQAFQNWWNGMSEQQRQEFRNRRGGYGGGRGGFGGGRGGFGGGRGG